MNKCLIDFYAQCRCGWKYGPGLQSDVVQYAKFHRKTCESDSKQRKAVPAF